MSQVEQEQNENKVVAIQGEEFDTKNIPAKFGKADQIIAALVDKYKDLTGIEPDDNKAYKELQAAITDCVSHRTGFEKTRKKIKESAIKFGKAVDDESTRLQNAVSVEEKRLKTIKESEDNRKEGVRLEVERIERERVGAIKLKINSIESLSVVTLDDSLEALEGKQHDLNDIVIDTTFEELAGVANEALLDARKIVDLAVEHRKQRDEEDARRAEEQAKLDADRKKLDEEADARKKADDGATEKLRQEQEDFQKEKSEHDAKVRKENEEREAREQRGREQKEAEEQRIRDEQAEETRKEEAKKNAEAQERALKQREEEAERQRKEKTARRDEAIEQAVYSLAVFIKDANSSDLKGRSLADAIIEHIELGNIPGIKAEYL